MTPEDLAATTASIMGHEGFAAKPQPDAQRSQVIGYGHSLTFNTLTQRAGLAILTDDLNATLTALIAGWPPFTTCDGPRQQMVAELAYQCGVEGALGFKDTLHYIAIKSYGPAIAALRNSDLARKCPARVADYVALLEQPHA